MPAAPHAPVQQPPVTPPADAFPRYTDHDPAMPIWCITPNIDRCIHRFFDTCPISPSGRYVALFRLPFEDGIGEPGESGEIVLVDLQTGEHKIVDRTAGWEPQMGANISWGPDDHTLLFNDVDTQTWTPFLVKLDPLTQKRERIEGSIYQASPCGRFTASANMATMQRTQIGYGVRLPDAACPRHIGPTDDDGLYITDIQTGERKLIVSLTDAAAVIPELRDEPEKWEVYGFHTKWSPAGDRLIFTVRRFPAECPERFNVLHAANSHMRFDVLTCRPDGSDLHNAVPAPRWEHGGHHINFHPDGEHLTMNLGGFGEGHRFVQVRFDGTDLHPMLPDTVGSGHPTVHPTANHILTDTYQHEKLAYGDGTTPMRWIDLDTAEEQRIARYCSKVEPQNHPALRIDPHPAWDRNWRWVTFNAVRDNTRRVYVADLDALLV